MWFRKLYGLISLLTSIFENRGPQLHMGSSVNHRKVDTLVQTNNVSGSKFQNIVPLSVLRILWLK